MNMNWTAVYLDQILAVSKGLYIPNTLFLKGQASQWNPCPIKHVFSLSLFHGSCSSAIPSQV